MSCIHKNSIHQGKAKENPKKIADPPAIKLSSKDDIFNLMAKGKKPAKTSTRKTVDEVIAGLPRDEQVMMKRLRHLILECLPKATETVKYRVPFYTRNRMICFLWPPSIFWGPNRTLASQKAKGLSLGFCQGNKMANENGVLLAEGRRKIYCLYFHSLNEIDARQIRALLFEAGMVDESFAKMKRDK